jgi:protein phosphatase
MIELDSSPVQNCPACGEKRKQGSTFCTKCRFNLAVCDEQMQRGSGTGEDLLQTKRAGEEKDQRSLFDGARDGFNRVIDSIAGTLSISSRKNELDQDPVENYVMRDGLTNPTDLTVSAPTIVLKRIPKSKADSARARPLRQNAGWLTNTGRKRDHNEDLVAALTFGLDQSGLSEPIGLYIVADGMGGQAAGEEASNASVRRAFLRFIEEQIMPDLRERRTRKLVPDEPQYPQARLASLVQEANRLVYQANQKTGSIRGTTITAVLVTGDRATIANVGDSRTYLLRNGTLERVTEDHSLVFRQYQAGLITEDQIYTHPQKNEIYRALGDSKEVQIDIYQHNLRAGDRLLLCSDGLWEMVRDTVIEQILTEPLGQQTACDRLVDEANKNGGEDNISVIVVSME